MGEILRHRCEACGYSADVGGGATGGMRAIMVTVVCRGCMELRDCLVAEWPDGEDPPLWAASRCSVNGRHPVEPWESGDPCPRCERPLNAEETVGIWD